MEREMTIEECHTRMKEVLGKFIEIDAKNCHVTSEATLVYTKWFLFQIDIFVLLLRIIWLIVFNTLKEERIKSKIIQKSIKDEKKISNSKRMY